MDIISSEHKINMFEWKKTKRNLKRALQVILPLLWPHYKYKQTSTNGHLSSTTSSLWRLPFSLVLAESPHIHSYLSPLSLQLPLKHILTFKIDHILTFKIDVTFWQWLVHQWTEFILKKLTKLDPYYVLLGFVFIWFLFHWYILIVFCIIGWKKPYFKIYCCNLEKNMCHISLLPPHNSDLSTMANFLCPLGGCCRVVQLYLINLVTIFCLVAAKISL